MVCVIFKTRVNPYEKSFGQILFRHCPEDCEKQIKTGRKKSNEINYEGSFAQMSSFFSLTTTFRHFFSAIMQLQLVTYFLLQKVLYSSVYKKSLDIWTFLCQSNNCRGCSCPAFWNFLFFLGTKLGKKGRCFGKTLIQSYALPSIVLSFRNVYTSFMGFHVYLRSLSSFRNVYTSFMGRQLNPCT